MSQAAVIRQPRTPPEPLDSILDQPHYAIDQEACRGCRCCVPTCPNAAIQGRFGRPHHIVARLCKECGMCATTCPYGAVLVN